MSSTTPEAILEFWFGPPPHRPRDAWFRKDASFDAVVRERFGDAVDDALAGGLVHWSRTARGALAHVILLDQFTRNIHRDTPRAFAGDALALAAAREAIARGFDRELEPIERGFLYLPFEHAESPALQERSVALFEALHARAPAALATAFAGFADYARRHRDVIARFGRFPHRNAALGRASTADELAWLADGNGF